MEAKEYIRQAKLLLEELVANFSQWPGPRALVVDALSDHIKKLEDNQNGIYTEQDLQRGLMIGLTFSDIRQLYNGGTIRCNAKDAGGKTDLRITIFLGGTDDHMREGLAKNPDVKGYHFDGRGDIEN